ncbi:hypothetical protein BGX33_010880 [Mortierella sp. NVP41]|nr:hypothetical protein BGX33_010880 [Mortierella sp. NVP41]
MFQIRADKIRRAIEEGKLATAEALQHRVIQRRESAIEGTQRTLNNTRDGRYNRDRSMSAPSERIHFAPPPPLPPSQSVFGVAPQLQQWYPSVAAVPITTQGSIPMNSHGNSSNSSVLIISTNTNNGMQEGTARAMGAGMALPGASARDPMLVEGEHQDMTFGLSDDDLMSSFTTFTAKLGDSLLAREIPRFGGIIPGGPATGAPNIGVMSPDFNTFSHNSNVTARQEQPLEMMMVDTASPTLSPTASCESQSPSPWMPWRAGEQDLVAGPHRTTMAVHPFAQAQAQGRDQVQGQVAQQATEVILPPPQQHQPILLSSLVVTIQQPYPSLSPKDHRDPSVHQAYGLDPQSVQIQPQGGLGGPGAAGGSYLGEKQVEAWNQYMQYLLHQQELAYTHNQADPLLSQQQQIPFGQPPAGPGLSYVASPPPPPVSSQMVAMDPHWQATMMTMMMGQNPNSEAIQGSGFGQQHDHHHRYQHQQQHPLGYISSRLTTSPASGTQLSL